MLIEQIESFFRDWHQRSNPKIINMRLGQAFIYLFKINESWPDLFYSTDVTYTKRIIREWAHKQDFLNGESDV